MAGFDPTHAVRFELPRGHVLAAGEERSVVLPCAALDDLVLVAGNEAAATIGKTLGTSLGKRVAARMGGEAGVRRAELEAVVAQIAGELAVLGLGVADIERWGRAMVVAVAQPAVRDLPFLASILEGMLEGATGTPVRCVALGREAGIARVLVAGDAGAARAQMLVEQGAGWGEVLARVQAQGGAP
jgi:hypothetical protein